MLVTSKRRYNKSAMTTFPIDHVALNLESFMNVAKQFIDVKVDDIDNDTAEITHRAVILKPKYYPQYLSKISELIGSGRYPSVIAREVLDFIICE